MGNSHLPKQSSGRTRMELAISLLSQTPSQKICLHEAYRILTEKYSGDRLKTYSRLFDLFHRDPEYLWNKKGFLHCTNLNILLRSLLLGSGHFSPSDIRFWWTQIWFCSPHQYVQVRIGNDWIDIDIWAKSYGISFGDHAYGFH